jgi:hypothetical protein
MRHTSKQPAEYSSPYSDLALGRLVVCSEIGSQLLLLVRA